MAMGSFCMFVNGSGNWDRFRAHKPPSPLYIVVGRTTIRPSAVFRVSFQVLFLRLLERIHIHSSYWNPKPEREDDEKRSPSCDRSGRFPRTPHISKPNLQHSIVLIDALFTFCFFHRWLRLFFLNWDGSVGGNREKNTWVDSFDVVATSVSYWVLLVRD